MLIDWDQKSVSFQAHLCDTGHQTKLFHADDWLLRHSEILHCVFLFYASFIEQVAENDVMSCFHIFS